MDKERHEPAPVPGWVCTVVAVGFLVFLVAGIVGVRVIGGGG